LPAVLRRRPVLAGGTVAATFAAVYLAATPAVGTKVIGVHPRYLASTGLLQGQRVHAAEAGLPTATTGAAAALIVAGTRWPSWHADPYRAVARTWCSPA